MRIRILPHRILDNTPCEAELYDSSLTEAVYAIRKLRLAIFYGDTVTLDVEESNQWGQVFVDKFGIWINRDEYQDQSK